MKKTKRALIMSIFSLILCFAMLTGSTMAWFTDTATSSGNKIQAGNLKVDLLQRGGVNASATGEYSTIKNSTAAIFGSAENANSTNTTLWEPGATHVAYLAVRNLGNLALKYNIVLDITDGGLASALEYAIVPQAQLNDASQGGNTCTAIVGSWDAACKATGVTTGTLAAGNQRITAATGGCLDAIADNAANKNETDYFALVIHMKEEAGNDYQGKDIVIDVNVVATQKDAESDSFNNTYDSQTELPKVAERLDGTGSTGGIRKTTGDTAETKVTVDHGSSTTEVEIDVKMDVQTEVQGGGTQTTETKIASATVSAPAAIKVMDALITADNEFESAPTPADGQTVTQDDVLVLTMNVATVEATTESTTLDISLSADASREIKLEETNKDTITTKHAISQSVTELTEAVTVEVQLDAGLEDVKVTHTHGTVSTEMTSKDSAVGLSDGEFYYDKSTGKLTLMTKKFSEFKIDYVYPYYAQIGNKLYASFEDAMNEVQTGQTITLLKDNSVQDSTTVNIDKSICIDLNNKTLTNYELVIKSDVVLKNGNVVNNNKNITPVTLYGAKLTIDGVIISTTCADALYVTNTSGASMVSSIIVADGSTNSIVTTGDGCDAIFAYALSNIELDIIGQTSKTGKLTLSGHNSSFHEYGASGNIDASISGLEILFTNKIDTGYGNTFSISDVNGSFATDVSDYCATGYYTKLNSEIGQYVYTMITEEDAVCRIIHSDETYAYCMSLPQAMMHVVDGETIQLLKDISISSTSDGLSAANVTFDLNNKTITSNGTWWIGKHNGNSNSPVTATIKNGNYVMGGTHSYGSGNGCIRFENASSGTFENVVFSTADGNWSKLLQVYATNKTGAEEINTYCFKNCTFTNCYTSFEGSSSSSNNYNVNFSGCTFTATNMSNGTSCILIDDYDYGKLSVDDTTFTINNTNNSGYCVNIDTYLGYTNGTKFIATFNNVTMNTTGNAQPYTYRFMTYDSSYSDNAVITTKGTNVFKHNDATVELAIKEVSANNKNIVWVENAEVFEKCYAEWKAYASASPACSSYNSSKYYLVESNGYYFIGGYGAYQFITDGTIVKNDQNVVTQVKPNSYYTYKTIGTTDISTELEAGDTDVKIYTLD